MPPPSLFAARDDRNTGAAYEYDIQATEDRHEDDEPTNSSEEPRHAKDTPVWQSINKPNYKPTALRWPFIGCIIVLLLVAMTLVIVADKKMPDSDADAVILGLNPNRTQLARLRIRDDEPTITISETSGAAGPQTFTIGAVPERATDALEQNSISTDTPLDEDYELIPISTFVSTFTTWLSLEPSSLPTLEEVVTEWQTLPVATYETTVTTLITSSGTRTDLDGPVVTTIYSPITNGTIVSSIPVSTRTTTIPPPAPTVIETTVITTIISSSEVAVTKTIIVTLDPEVVLKPSVGSITITYYSSVPRRNNGAAGAVEHQITEGPEQVPQPPVITGVEEVGGNVVTIVKSQEVSVFVVPEEDEVRTETVDAQVRIGVTKEDDSTIANVVVVTPSPVQIVPAVVTNNGVVLTVNPGGSFTRTVVNNVGGTATSQVIVTTPAGTNPITYTVVRDQGGTLVAEAVVITPTADQPITYTAYSVNGGTPVTQFLVETPPPAFQPVTLTISTIIGGTPVVTTTQQPPVTIIEIINGTPVTRVSTLPVTSYTTTIGGTPTITTIVTTPTDTSPITMTLTSISEGTFRTYTTTISATTYLTTISGTLRTVTSTLPPITSFTTLPKSLYTFTSTLSVSSTPPTSTPSSIPSRVRVYSWTESDIFIGTFLPALLGVGLVIPLRILDLNAKLYQPWQALAKHGGGPGSQTLLLQYSGVLGVVWTPIVGLFSGKAVVPFLTTLMVACASFFVPLATEAVGLKLHGECYLNTASSRCGPALGVSRGPAYALVGLLAAVVVLVGVVGWLVSRWVTGVAANPWNVAGVASLAGSRLVRVRENGEHDMRRAMAEKIYGLASFRGEHGKEEYGIVLLDEAGRRLNDDREGETLVDDRDGNDPGAAMHKEKGGEGIAGLTSKQLPFMTLRYPWRIVFVLFQLAVLIFIIYYHAYYRGGIRDGGRLWLFLNANRFGVRFVSAIIGVIIAFCWQSFFLSVSIMAPYQLMATKTQPAIHSILFSPNTNPFSGIWSAIKHRHAFLGAVSGAAILSEFLPVILSNVPFNLAQTQTAATVCAVLSCVFLILMISTLVWSFFIRYPPMPVDPRCIAGLLYYVSRSRMVVEERDFQGLSRLDRQERELRIRELGRRYFYGVLAGSSERRLGVDCDAGTLGEGMHVSTEYKGAGALSRAV